MSITLKKDNVNLEASFEKLKSALRYADQERDFLDKYSILNEAIENHLKECTTSDDVPTDLFTQLGNYFKPE